VIYLTLTVTILFDSLPARYPTNAETLCSSLPRNTLRISHVLNFQPLQRETSEKLNLKNRFLIEVLPRSNEPLNTNCISCGIFKIVASEWMAVIGGLKEYFAFEDIAVLEKKDVAASSRVEEVLSAGVDCRQNVDLLEAALRDLERDPF
jgi:hypothetical protein